MQRGDSYRFFYKNHRTGYEQTGTATWNDDMTDRRRVREGRAFTLDGTVLKIAEEIVEDDG